MGGETVGKGEKERPISKLEEFKRGEIDGGVRIGLSTTWNSIDSVREVDVPMGRFWYDITSTFIVEGGDRPSLVKKNILFVKWLTSKFLNIRSRFGRKTWEVYQSQGLKATFVKTRGRTSIFYMHYRTTFITKIYQMLILGLKLVYRRQEFEPNWSRKFLWNCTPLCMFEKLSWNLLSVKERSHTMDVYQRWPSGDFVKRVCKNICIWECKIWQKIILFLLIFIVRKFA